MFVRWQLGGEAFPPPPRWVAAGVADDEDQRGTSAVVGDRDNLHRSAADPLRPAFDVVGVERVPEPVHRVPAAGDVQVAGLVEVTEVVGPVPSVRRRLRRAGGAVQVTSHQPRRPDLDLAGVSSRDSPPARVHDPDADPG